MTYEDWYAANEMQGWTDAEYMIGFNAWNAAYDIAQKQGVKDGLRKAIALANEKYASVESTSEYARGAQTAYGDLHDALLDMLEAE